MNLARSNCDVQICTSQDYDEELEYESSLTFRIYFFISSSPSDRPVLFLNKCISIIKGLWFMSSPFRTTKKYSKCTRRLIEMFMMLQSGLWCSWERCARTGRRVPPEASRNATATPTTKRLRPLVATSSSRPAAKTSVRNPSQSLSLLASLSFIRPAGDVGATWPDRSHRQTVDIVVNC